MVKYLHSRFNQRIKENPFYIDVKKNIISYFTTVKMLFVIFFPVCCKKMKHPSFIIHFSKRLEDKWWLGVGMGWRDRQLVVTSCVNASWLSCLLCNTVVER